MTRVITVKPGVGFEVGRLKQMLPNVKVLAFFGKFYKLTADQLSAIMLELFGSSDVVTALLASGQEHSHELQDYYLELGYDELIEHGLIDLTDTPPPGEVLPELWELAQIEIADSIQKVVDKLDNVVSKLPGKQGEMLFQSLAMMNAKRPVVGDHKAVIQHAPQKQNLVVLDCSGSMTERTVRALVEDVVALSYKANAHLAIVSSTATHWGPGEFSVDEVLAAAEYAGTQYETLSPLFESDWGVVVTIADYDSSHAAKEAFKLVSGRVDQVLDISLVGRPTFLSEVIGIVADEVKPLLVAQNDYCCMSNH